MVISKSIKSILKHSFSFVLIAVFSTFATKVASAKTINNSTLFADETRLTYFDNLFNREDYNYYLLGVVNEGSTYSYNNYYICLSNEKINLENGLNANLNCEKMYRYYRNNSSNYTLETVNDNKLVLNNSIYYSNSKLDNNYYQFKFVIFISIGISTILLLIVLFRIFKL